MKKTTKYCGLVNRKRVIATLEAKALITGFRWIRPDKIPNGFVENHGKKGNFLYYCLTKPVRIRDVDGKEKVTVQIPTSLRISRRYTLNVRYHWVNRETERQANRERKAEEKKTALELYTAGVSPTEIAKRVGCGRERSLGG